MDTRETEQRNTPSFYVAHAPGIVESRYYIRSKKVSDEKSFVEQKAFTPGENVHASSTFFCVPQRLRRRPIAAGAAHRAAARHARLSGNRQTHNAGRTASCVPTIQRTFSVSIIHDFHRAFQLHSAIISRCRFVPDVCTRTLPTFLFFSFSFFLLLSYSFHVLLFFLLFLYLFTSFVPSFLLFIYL